MYSDSSGLLSTSRKCLCVLFTAVAITPRGPSARKMHSVSIHHRYHILDPTNCELNSLEGKKILLCPDHVQTFSCQYSLNNVISVNILLSTASHAQMT